MSRRKGRDTPNGFWIVDKPAGLTSAHVVAKIKRRFRLKKVGHAGTLDPLATGVLPIAVNEATKLAGYLSDRGKSYRTECRLGVTTDTYDREGEITSEQPVTCNEAEIHRALESFRGSILQVPPMYSAKKRDGQPLYKLARQGEVIERKAVNVDVYELNLESIDETCLRLNMSVSKGFYVRSLCKDLGDKLGCGGHMQSLMRLAHGPFSLSESLPLDALLDSDDAEAFARMLALESEALDIPMLQVDEKSEKRIRHGHPLLAGPAAQAFTGSNAEATTWRVLDPQGRLMALMEALHPAEDWSALPADTEALRVLRGIAEPTPPSS